MAIILNWCWHVIIYHIIDFWKVQTTLRNVCCDQDLKALSTETRQIWRSICLAQVTVNSSDCSWVRYSRLSCCGPWLACRGTYLRRLDTWSTRFGLWTQIFHHLINLHLNILCDVFRFISVKRLFQELNSLVNASFSLAKHEYLSRFAGYVFKEVLFIIWLCF